MFDNYRLNDEYELHQCRFSPLTKDELDILVTDARVSHPRWYNGLLAQIGESLIAVGRSLKERNSGVNTTLPYEPCGG